MNRNTVTDRVSLGQARVIVCVCARARTIKTHNLHLNVAQRLQWFYFYVEHSVGPFYYTIIIVVLVL